MTKWKTEWKKPKILSADGCRFEKGKTYYYWTRDNKIQRIVITKEQHISHRPTSRSDEVLCSCVYFRNIEGYFDTYMIGRLGLDEGCFYRKKDKCKQALLKLLIKQRKVLDKQIAELEG